MYFKQKHQNILYVYTLLKIIFIFTLLNISFCNAETFKYILHDKCINFLWNIANENIKNDDIEIIRDSRGIILRFSIPDLKAEYYKLSPKTITDLNSIEYFLAKIKNPVIIEVHTDGVSKEIIEGLKNWEVSTVIANNIGEAVFSTRKELDRERIISVGYGEFLPSKNTPNNGGKFLNRVDIIILCNISGE